MYSLHTALVELLTGYLSPIIARSILTRALREHGLDAAGLDAASLQALAPRLDAAVKLFVEPAIFEAFRAGLTDLIGEVPGKESLTLHIKSERDLVEALSETRRLCQSWRVRPIAQQKIATVVSELARNIVSYTPGDHERTAFCPARHARRLRDDLLDPRNGASGMWRRQRRDALYRCQCSGSY